MPALEEILAVLKRIERHLEEIKRGSYVAPQAYEEPVYGPIHHHDLPASTPGNAS